MIPSVQAVKKHRKGFMQMKALTAGVQQSHVDKVYNVTASPVQATQTPPPSDDTLLESQDVDHIIHEKLGDQYAKELRPSADVYMRLSLRKIIALDPFTRVLSLSIWLNVAWPDYRLKYNASESLPEITHNRHWNSSTDYVSVPESKVWVPNVRLLNKIKESELMERSPRVLWYDETKLAESGYNLEATWPMTIHGDCSVNLRDWPFDEQTCQLIFGDLSATEQGSKLHATDANLKNRQFEIRSENDELQLRQVKYSATTVRSRIIESIKSSAVVYELTIARKPDYYLLKFVLPEFLLVLFGHSIYYIEQGDSRISNGITIVLAVMTVSFLTIAVMPSAPEVMWIERFQVGCYILTCIPAFVSIFMDHLAVTLQRSGWIRETITVWDVTARAWHSVLVIIFYFYMFPIGSHSLMVWTTSPDLFWFFLINVLIFVVLFAVAITDAIGFKERVKRKFRNIHHHVGKVKEAYAKEHEEYEAERMQRKKEEYGDNYLDR